MADHGNGNDHETEKKAGDHEATDRGCFNFFKKKEEVKPHEYVAMADADKAKANKRPTLIEQLHRSDGKSSSSSDEEEGEKKRKKKGLKEKIKKKIAGEKEEDADVKDANAEAKDSEKEKGFLDKIKDKFPGHHHRKAEEQNTATECSAAACEHSSPDCEPKEKRRILEKIKEKIPGCHQNEEEKN